MRRASHPVSEWVAVDVAEDEREAARIAVRRGNVRRQW